MSDKPYTLPNYDIDSFEEVLLAILKLGKHNSDTGGMFKPKDEVDSLQCFLGTVFDFGGLPKNEATCLNVTLGLPVGDHKVEVSDNPVDAFWSVSMYNMRGF